MNKKYYLAYGSNLNLEAMSHKCPNAKVIGTTNLNGYRLVYKGRENEFSYLTIEECEGYSVPIGIFEVNDEDIKALDEYEGYPMFYSKKYFPIKVGDKEIEALIYVMKSHFDYHLPNEKYVSVCTKGYDNFGFDKEVLNQAMEDTVENFELGGRVRVRELTKKI